MDASVGSSALAILFELRNVFDAAAKENIHRAD